MRPVTDVVIVGAGVMGGSAAFHLARLRLPRVIVVEKGALASGMTKRSGALIRTHFAHAGEAQLAQASLPYFQNWKDRVGGTCGFAQTGLGVIARDETGATELREQVARLQAIGVNTRIVSREELQKLEPAARVDDVTLAAYDADAGYADPVATTQMLTARAKEMGVVFKTGTLVKSIRVERGRVTAVETTTGPIETATVVVMAGAWSDRLLKPLGVEIGIRAERVQVAYFERPPELRKGHAAFWDLSTGAHFRPHTFGLTQGGLSATDSVATNPDQFDETIPPAFIAQMQQHIAARLPAMARAKFVRGHAGVHDMTPDGHAVLDRAPGLRGLVIAAGFNGVGFGFAPAVGACIAELIVDGEARTVDLYPFRWRAGK